jgi:hypothetical protein
MYYGGKKLLSAAMEYVSPLPKFSITFKQHSVELKKCFGVVGDASGFSCHSRSEWNYLGRVILRHHPVDPTGPLAEQLVRECSK